MNEDVTDDFEDSMSEVSNESGSNNNIALKDIQAKLALLLVTSESSKTLYL